MKKTLITTALLVLTAASASAQHVKQLPIPDKSLNVSLTEAIGKRKSDRDFNTGKAVDDQQLSLILWAACGINRTDEDLLTIPTATNAQDIQVHVCRQEGVSLYDPRANTLTMVTGEDIRPLLADRQQSVGVAPVFLLLVSDQTRFRHNGEHWGAMDAGYASENICLMCAALGLKTVPRGIMNQAAIAQALSLPETTLPELNHPIGY